MADLLLGLLTLAMKGGVAVATVYWLTSRRVTPGRLAGGMIAAAVSAYCTFAIFALIADNAGDLPRNLTMGGDLVLSVLATIAISTIAVANSNLKRRRLVA